MQMLRSVIAAALLPLFVGTAAAQSDLPERMEKARAAAGDFGAKLLAALQKAMAEGGPVNAIGVCNTTAPEIAAEKSAAAQMSVGRTSLKLRQPKNAPEFRGAQGGGGDSRRHRGGRIHGRRREARLPLHEGDPDRSALPQLPRRAARTRGGGEAARALSRGSRHRLRVGRLARRLYHHRATLTAAGLRTA